MNRRDFLKSSQFAVSTALLSSTLAGAALSHVRRLRPLAHPFESIPMQLDGWQGGEGPPISQTALDFLKATSALSRTYRGQRGSLDLFVAYYENQRAGESLHSPRHCLPGTGWEVLDHDLLRITVNGAVKTINKYTVQQDRNKLIILYWYQSRERTIASEYAGKFWLVWDGVLTGDTAGAIVRISVPPSLLPEALSFASHALSAVEDCFGK